VLNAALETSTRANQALIEAGEQPLISSFIKRGKVIWQPERFQDGEHFDLATDVIKRGWGDCDDLAPAYAAELRATGKDKGARAFARPSGPNRWHALVRLSNGRELDPSKAAGMGKGRIRGRGIQRVLQNKLSGRGALGVKRAPKGWAARCDLPLDGTDMHVSGLGLEDTIEDAIEQAIHGAALVGELANDVDEETLRRALALQAALTGDEELAEELEGEDEVGFLPLAAALAPSAINLAKGLLPGGKKKGAAPAPAPAGGGGGRARPALAATPAGGGAPVTVTPYSAPAFGPGPGPIVIRF
jgi:hypothetical protein